MIFTKSVVLRCLASATAILVSGCVVFKPQITKEPPVGQKIAIARLNVAVLMPGIKPQNERAAIKTGGGLTPSTSGGVNVQTELVKTLPEQLAPAKYFVEAKNIYSAPGEPSTSLSSEFTYFGSGTHLLMVAAIRSQTSCGGM